MAAIDDIEKLIQSRFDYFRTEGWEITPERHREIRANLERYFTQHLNTVFFAAIIEENDKILSLAFLAISEKPASPFFPTGKTGTILNVLTYPEYRRNGYATRTMNALIDEAKRQNLSYIELSATEAGKPLYQKLGFAELAPSSLTAMKMSLI